VNVVVVNVENVFVEVTVVERVVELVMIEVEKVVVEVDVTVGTRR